MGRRINESQSQQADILSEGYKGYEHYTASFLATLSPRQGKRRKEKNFTFAFFLLPFIFLLPLE
jgi:hypothetical protein